MKEYLPPYKSSQTAEFPGYPKLIGKTIDWLRWDGISIFRVQFTLGSKPTEGQILFVYDFATGELLAVENYQGKCKSVQEQRPLSIYFDAVRADKAQFYAKRAALFASIAKLQTALDTYNATGKTAGSKDAYLAVKKEKDLKDAEYRALFEQAVLWGPYFAKEEPQFRMSKDSYLKAHVQWQEAGSPPDKKPLHSTWLDVFDENAVLEPCLEVAKIVSAKGGPWSEETPNAGTEKESSSPPKKPKRKRVPFTAHCQFPVYLPAAAQSEPGVATKEDALKVAKDMKVLVLKAADGAYSHTVEAYNWRGVKMLPPEQDGNRWSLGASIKIFFDAFDVADARKQLDRLYPSVRLCWPDGRPKLDEMQVATTGAWSFSIQPSTQEESIQQNRMLQTWPECKAWQN